MPQGVHMKMGIRGPVGTTTGATSTTFCGALSSAANIGLGRTVLLLVSISSGSVLIVIGALSVLASGCSAGSEASCSFSLKAENFIDWCRDPNVSEATEEAGDCTIDRSKWSSESDRCDRGRGDSTGFGEEIDDAIEW